MNGGPTSGSGTWLVRHRPLFLKWTSACSEKGAESDEDKAALCEDNSEAKFYAGKVMTARFFVSEVLPEVGAKAKTIGSRDRSALNMAF